MAEIVASHSASAFISWLVNASTIALFTRVVKVIWNEEPASGIALLRRVDSLLSLDLMEYPSVAEDCLWQSGVRRIS